MIRSALGLISLGSILTLSFGSMVCHGQATVRMSVSSTGAEGNGTSNGFASISKTGRFVAFRSSATNFDGGGGGVFMHDRDPDDDGIFDEGNGVTLRMSQSESGVLCYGYGIEISSDGRFATFESGDPGMMIGAPSVGGIYVHDRDPDENGIFDEGNHTIDLVSLNSDEEVSDAPCGSPDISDDGRYVIFESFASNLVEGHIPGAVHVYVRDRLLGTTSLVDINRFGEFSNGPAGITSISNDGTKVLFQSNASDLVAGDSNGMWGDVYLRNLSTGTTTLVGVNTLGEQGVLGSASGRIAGDGRHIVFVSSTLPGDSTFYAQVYARDLHTGITHKLSVPNAGGSPDGESIFPDISDDGRFVTFYTAAENMVDGDATFYGESVVRDRDPDGNGVLDEGGENELLALNASGEQANSSSFEPSISGDGHFVAFYSGATNLVPADSNFRDDIFVRAYCPADSESFGVGWPGTLGVPELSISAHPVLGDSVTLMVGNSLGTMTTGVFFYGLTRVELPTALGGTFLVEPLGSLPLVLPSDGLSFPLSIPDDDALCGLSVYAQVLELDTGASVGVSFSDGLRLRLGR